MVLINNKIKIHSKLGKYDKECKTVNQKKYQFPPVCLLQINRFL